MEWAPSIFGFGATVVILVLTARLNVGLLANGEEIKKVALAVTALIVGAMLGRAILARVATQDLVFTCEPLPQVPLFYICGGWPVLGDLGRDFAQALFRYITNFSLITPAFAGLVGGLYIHRLLITTFRFDWMDVIKIFGGGFFLMISILLIPKISTGLISTLTAAGNYGELVSQGRQNLGALTQLIVTASEEAARRNLTWWMDTKIVILRLSVFGLAGIINVIGPLFILLQSLVFLTAPIALLGAVLSDRPSWSRALEICLSYAGFFVIQIIYWITFTLAPKVKEPDSIQSVDMMLSGQAFLLSVLILVVSLGLLYIAGFVILIPLLKKIVGRL